MAIRYDAWLAATGRKGTEADAMVWKKTHGVALGLYNPDGTRKYAPAIPPPDPNADPRIIQAIGQQRAIPGQYNDTRRTMANMTLRDLINEGLIETGSLGEERSASGIAEQSGADIPNVVYKIVRGEDGRAYKQAFLNVGASQNRRGFLESSQTNQRQAEARSALNRQVDDALFRLGTGQQESLGRQRGDISNIGSDIAGWRAEIAQQAAAIPAIPTSVASAAAKAATPPAKVYTPAQFSAWRQAAKRPALSPQAFRSAYWTYRQKKGRPVAGARI